MGTGMGPTNLASLTAALTAANKNNGGGGGNKVSTNNNSQAPLTMVQLPDINVINVPEYPERTSRRVVVPTLKAPGPQQQQNKGLSAPLADLSSSGPNGNFIIFVLFLVLLHVRQLSSLCFVFSLFSIYVCCPIIWLLKSIPPMGDTLCFHFNAGPQ